MLINFSVENYLSFRDEVTFSMLSAKSVKEHVGDNDSVFKNTIDVSTIKSSLLKFASIYGANGAGKSNLIKSIYDLKKAVLRSLQDDKLFENMSRNVFQFDFENLSKPSTFEITFLENGDCYRYGFEIFSGTVESEWLFKKPLESSAESYCFKREKNKVQINKIKFKGASGVLEKTRKDALFLSTCAQFNVREAMIVKEWFRKKLTILSCSDDYFSRLTEYLIQDPNKRAVIEKFVESVDSNIKGINIKESKISIPSDLPSELKDFMKKIIDSKEKDGEKNYDIFAIHDRYRDEQKVDRCEMSFNSESEGTQKMLSLSGPLLSTIFDGGVLLIDEFGASLHTKLCIELVKLYQLKSNNIAQMIVSTHDINLLRKDLLRRDQIWFAEKDNYGVTDIYSLVEYKINQATSVRNDASYSKNYLIGRYGAIPYFGDIDKFYSDFLKHDQ